MEKEQLLIERAEEEIIEKIKIDDKWQIENDLVLKEIKLYITKDKNLRLEIF